MKEHEEFKRISTEALVHERTNKGNDLALSVQSQVKLF